MSEESAVRGRQIGGSWLVAALLCAIAYAFIGVTTAALAHGGWAQVRGWRLAAWFSSALIFLAHVRAERSRAGNSAKIAAWHAAAGAALGAFGLAAAALVHALTSGTGKPRLLALALASWPALTFVPAFLVALVAAAVMPRFGSRKA